jgi:hypothetical protein
MRLLGPPVFGGAKSLRMNEQTERGVKSDSETTRSGLDKAEAN